MNTKRLLQFVMWHIGVLLYFPVLITLVSVLSPYVPSSLTGGSVALVVVLGVVGVAGVMGTIGMDVFDLTIVEALREAFPPQQEEKKDDPKQADWR